jgi:hypothetical protein
LGSFTIVFEFLDEIQTKVSLKSKSLSFPPCYSQSTLALRFLFLYATSYGFYFSVTIQYNVKEKRGKPNRKPYPLPYGLRNQYTVKKRFASFPSPSRDVTTKLSLGGNNDVITELFLPRGSLVSDIPAGDGKLVTLFLRCTETSELSRLCKEISTKLYVHEFGFWTSFRKLDL